VLNLMGESCATGCRLQTPYVGMPSNLCVCTHATLLTLCCPPLLTCPPHSCRHVEAAAAAAGPLPTIIHLLTTPCRHLQPLVSHCY
jgi:hypothetical protein